MQTHFHGYIWRFGPQLSDMIPCIHLWTNILPLFQPKNHKGVQKGPQTREFSGGKAATWAYQFICSWAPIRKKSRDKFMGEPTDYSYLSLEQGELALGVVRAVKDSK